MSNLIFNKENKSWTFKDVDFGSGMDCIKITFSNLFIRESVRVDVFADLTPIGVCMLVKTKDTDVSYCDIAPLSGVHDIMVKLPLIDIGRKPEPGKDTGALRTDIIAIEPTTYKKSDYVPADPKKFVDVNSSSWVATDMLGRKVANVSDVKSAKKEKKVGVFYWTWRDSSSHLQPVNVSKVLEEYPAAEYNYDHPAWGSNDTHQCHWSEPLYGFYRNNDPYIIRKHAIMLANAGVDFLMFDCTNGSIVWKDAYEPLLEGLYQARLDGIKTPQVAFMLNFSAAETTEYMLRALYQDLYNTGKYRDLWFEVEGKPVIMAYPEALPKEGVCEHDTQKLNEIRNFFTFRPGRPLYAGGPTRNDQWGWLEIFPQNKFVTRKDGTCEQVTVGVGQNANHKRICTYFNDVDTFGRSYTFKDQFSRLTKDSYKYGYNVQEQWDRAIDLDPDIVFITSWNEWTMGRYGVGPWVQDEHSKQVAMVDQFDRERSRDIEPDKDGYLDTYYLQMAHNIRRFKGATAMEKPSAPKEINIQGSTRQWKDVTPTYLNHKGSAINRDWDGLGNYHYTNNSAANDIISAKVTRDEKNMYFIAECSNELTSPTQNGWMSLYIDSDRNKATGWEGYDFVINRTAPKNGKTTVEAYMPTADKNSFTWQTLGKARIKIKANAVVIEIPREMLNMADKKLNFEFKWSDNMQKADVMDFYENGDTAPFGRFNYLFKE